jgi:CBS domain containing-hemolysin-like protein
MATALALNTFGSNGVAVATGAMTLLILTFGEIIPKALATKHNVQIALFMAPIINLMAKLFAPLVWAFDKFTTMILPHQDIDQPQITEEEVRGMVKMSEEEGSIKRQEEEMIQNIFKLDDTYAADIMTARPDVFSLSIDLKVEDVLPEVKEKLYSRIPVYTDDLDNTEGILYVKDLLRADDHTMLKDLVRPVFYVPETKRVDTLLREFKQKKMHLAMVVNEHGTVVGLVTIEDLLEEIVGEIYDEDDMPEGETNPIREIADHHFMIEGRAELDEVEEALEMKMDDEDSSTLSGFVMTKLNRVPEKGDVFQFKNYRFIVKEIDGQRVEQVEIIKKKIEVEN